MLFFLCWGIYQGTVRSQLRKKYNIDGGSRIFDCAKMCFCGYCCMQMLIMEIESREETYFGCCGRHIVNHPKSVKKMHRLRCEGERYQNEVRRQWMRVLSKIMEQPEVSNVPDRVHNNHPNVSQLLTFFRDRPGLCRHVGGNVLRFYSPYVSEDFLPWTFKGTTAATIDRVTGAGFRR